MRERDCFHKKMELITFFLGVNKRVRDYNDEDSLSSMETRRKRFHFIVVKNERKKGWSSVRFNSQYYQNITKITIFCFRYSTISTDTHDTGSN